MMEDETGFLSKEDDDKERIKILLNKILLDLNEKKVTTIVEGETTIYLKIVTHQPDPPIVYDHLVPLFCPDYENMPLDIWDLTTQQVQHKHIITPFFFLQINTHNNYLYFF